MPPAQVLPGLFAIADSATGNVKRQGQVAEHQRSHRKEGPVEYPSTHSSTIKRMFDRKILNPFEKKCPDCRGVVEFPVQPGEMVCSCGTHLYLTAGGAIGAHSQLRA